MTDPAADRPSLAVVRSETQLRALEALRQMRDDYGLAKLMKPCVAFVLDGNGGGDRHEQAFIVAIEMRALGLSEKETERVLVKWAKTIGYRERDACRAIRNAYAKTPGGKFRYHAPGLVKREGTRAARVLAPTCADVGCPSNCPQFSGVAQGPRGETFERFEGLRWPEALKRTRHGAAVDIYRAICELEDGRGFAPGAKLLTSTKQLATIAGRDRRHVLTNLRTLYHRGLCSFTPGSGSGPHARDRQPSEVVRTVPIPSPPARLLQPQSKTGGVPPSEIGGVRPPGIGGASPSDIGGAP